MFILCKNIYIVLFAYAGNEQLGEKHGSYIITPIKIE